MRSQETQKEFYIHNLSTLRTCFFLMPLTNYIGFTVLYARSIEDQQNHCYNHCEPIICKSTAGCPWGADRALQLLLLLKNQLQRYRRHGLCPQCLFTTATQPPQVAINLHVSTICKYRKATKFLIRTDVSSSVSIVRILSTYIIIWQ